jgi:hypothetical protein
LKSIAPAPSRRASAPTAETLGALKNVKGIMSSIDCEVDAMVESKRVLIRNINIDHVLCYDIACAVWIVQQNSGSTEGKRGQKRRWMFLLLSNAIADTQKSNNIPLYGVYYSGHVKIGAKTSIAIVLAIKPSVFNQAKEDSGLVT